MVTVSCIETIYCAQLFHSLIIFLISGLFPNHIPNPEDKVAMKAITSAVLENKADLGIIFDTDVDRWYRSSQLNLGYSVDCWALSKYLFSGLLL